MADISQPTQIHHIQPRVGRSFGEHHVSRLGSIVELRGRCLPHRDSQRRKAFPCVPPHLVVAVKGHDQD